MLESAHLEVCNQVADPEGGDGDKAFDLKEVGYCSHFTWGYLSVKQGTWNAVQKYKNQKGWLACWKGLVALALVCLLGASPHLCENAAPQTNTIKNIAYPAVLHGMEFCLYQPGSAESSSAEFWFAEALASWLAGWLASPAQVNAAAFRKIEANACGRCATRATWCMSVKIRNADPPISRNRCTTTFRFVLMSMLHADLACVCAATGGEGCVERGWLEWFVPRRGRIRVCFTY